MSRQNSTEILAHRNIANLRMRSELSLGVSFFIVNFPSSHYFFLQKPNENKLSENNEEKMRKFLINFTFSP